MRLFNKIFNYIVFIQIIMFSVFILLNFYNLDEIEIQYVLDSDTTYYVLNFYTLLAILIAIMIFGVLTSLNIFGGGLNEEGSKLLMKYLSIVLFMAIMFTSSIFFLLPLGFLGIILNVFFILVYSFKIFEDMIERGNVENE